MFLLPSCDVFRSASWYDVKELRELPSLQHLFLHQSSGTAGCSVLMVVSLAFSPTMAGECIEKLGYSLKVWLCGDDVTQHPLPKIEP